MNFKTFSPDEKIPKNVIFPAQNRGIGTKLLKFFADKIRAQNFPKVFSSSQKSEMLPQKFHEKNGFEKVGEIKMIFGTEIFFAKKI